MSPEEAFAFIQHEFIKRFGMDAEGCCNVEDTIKALETLYKLILVNTKEEINE